MVYKIVEIQGIGPSYSTKLASAEIYNTEDLLEKCGTSSARGDVSERTGVAAATLLKWANMADLMRISGIGPQFAELLEASGVDTVKELRHRNAQNLAATLLETNKLKRLAKTSPTANVIEGWVQAANSMEPRIEY